MGVNSWDVSYWWYKSLEKVIFSSQLFICIYANIVFTAYDDTQKVRMETREYHKTIIRKSRGLQENTIWIGSES